MAGALGLSGGKQRSQTSFTGAPLKTLEKQFGVVGGERELGGQLMSQLSEALRTGGVGAQIPLIQQGVSQANQALSSALRGTQDQLAASGLSRTPFGARTLAETRQQGLQGIARIPTDTAQQFISLAPQYSQGIFNSILGTLQKSTARSGPYST